MNKKAVVTSPTDIRLSVNAELFWLASQFKAENDIRYYLDGVLVEKHPELGAYVIATNGHVMGVFYDPTATYEFDEPRVILKLNADGLKFIRPGAKIYRSSVQPRIIVRDGKRLTVTRTEDLFIQPGDCFIEGNFPEWRRVVPKLDTLKIGLSECINQKYLDLVFKIARIKEREGRWSGVTAYRKDDLNSSVVVFKISTIPNSMILVMPMNAEGAETDPVKAFAFIGQDSQKKEEPAPC